MNEIEQSGFDQLQELVDELEAENRALKRSMLRIVGMAGIPDAAYACRKIIGEIKRVYINFPESPLSEPGPEPDEK